MERIENIIIQLWKDIEWNEKRMLELHEADPIINEVAIEEQSLIIRRISSEISHLKCTIRIMEKYNSPLY